MAFNSNPPKQSYQATEGQTVFPFIFKIYADDNLAIYIQTGGEEISDSVPLILGVDYTATVDGDNGGVVTLNVGADAEDIITIYRALDITRLVDYQTSGDLLANTLNADQDYQTYLILDISSKINDIVAGEYPGDQSAYVLKAGDVLTGPLRGIAPINNADLTRKDYVDAASTAITNSLFINANMVDTIAELEVQSGDIGVMVVLDILRGGMFTYDASRSGENNGGTVFNGWVRHFSGQVSVLWFGAYNDNTHPVETVAAIEGAIATLAKTIYFPPGTYSVDSTITVNKGQKMQGECGLRFTDNQSKIVMTLDDTLVFDQSLSVSTGQESAMSCCDIYIESDKCIRLNDETILIEAEAASPFLMRGEFKRNTFIAKIAGNGYGILASKMFDSIIEHNEFKSHAREIVLQGCDLNRISTNRIWSFTEYGILELGIGTFNSQNRIVDNDILNGDTNSIYIKTTSRHIRIIDNYLEKAPSYGTCLGFIDASLIDCPTYGSNPIATYLGFSTVIKENRIDGQETAVSTDFVYRIDQTKMISCTIEDSLTAGAASDKWLTVVNDYLDLMYGYGIMKTFDLLGGGNSGHAFSNFKTKKITTSGGSFNLDAENLADIYMSGIYANLAYQHIALSSFGIIVKPELGDTIARIELPPSNGIPNPYMRIGESWEVVVVARTFSGSDSIDVMIVIGGMGSGNVSTPIDAVNTEIVIPFIAGGTSDSIGIGIRRMNTPIGNVIIQSIEFRKV